MNRIDRLFAILLRISDGKLFRAEELASTFELSERTIYRDMRALVEMGIPIRSEAGVGYQLKSGYFIPPLLFDKEEAIGVGFALRFLKRNSLPNFNAAATRTLNKIRAVLPHRVRLEFDRSLSMIDVLPTKTPIVFSGSTIEAVLQAIRNHHLLELEYAGFGQVTFQHRLVEPTRLFLSPGKNIWYLDAFCRTKGAWRSFRLDRIRSFRQTTIVFHNRESRVTGKDSPPASTTSAVLHILTDQVRWVKECQHWSFVREWETTEGTTCMLYENFGSPSFIGWVCSISDSVLRLESPDLRDELNRKIESLKTLLT